ncbi:MAG: hypothetical protein QME66_04775 [Candidatus Eisenbacteria bacterium]|nr:hypothetical protein [Candidatus Eisenbacteria bacterium]
MEVPKIVHPRLVLINNIKFRVITYFPVTDDEARKIALWSYRTQGRSLNVVS